MSDDHTPILKGADWMRQAIVDAIADESARWFTRVVRGRTEHFRVQHDKVTHTVTGMDIESLRAMWSAKAVLKVLQEPTQDVLAAAGSAQPKWREAIEMVMPEVEDDRERVG